MKSLIKSIIVVLTLFWFNTNDCYAVTPKVSKSRSGTRGHYSSVNCQSTYEQKLNPDGSISTVLVEIRLLCVGSEGDLNCKTTNCGSVQGIVNSNDFQEFEISQAEKVKAQQVIDFVENQLDNSILTGNYSEAVTIQLENGTQISRVFRGEWSTDFAGKQSYSVWIESVN